MTADERNEIAVVVHDLRNLLQITASALFQVGRLMDAPTRERVRRYEHAASEALARAGLLSRMLLDQAGSSSRPLMETILPGAVLSKIRQLIELAAGATVQVGFEIADDVPAVTCCVSELENAILNLVVNARDAMPAGGVLIVSLLRDQGTAVLRVRDSGTGMSVAAAARVFESRFTTKAATGGRGLGLAMVRRFAERSAGTAEIDSAPGSGTIVTLRLPGTLEGRTLARTI